MKHTHIAFLLAVLLAWGSAFIGAAQTDEVKVPTPNTTADDVIDTATLLDPSTDEELFNIFKNKDLLKLMIGEKARFVYEERGDDPMVVPWLVAEKEAQILFDRAMKIWKEKGKDPRKWTQALLIRSKLKDSYADTNVWQENEDSMATWEAEFEKQFPVDGPPTGESNREKPFPKWVKESLTTLVYAEEESRRIAMINTVIYRPGQPIRGTGQPPLYKDVVILEDIKPHPTDDRKSMAIFKYHDKTYYFGIKGDLIPGFENPTE